MPSHGQDTHGAFAFLSREASEAAKTEERFARERDRDKRIADAEAHHALADLHMPDDLRSLAERHKLGNLMEMVWRAGWQSGFRVGLVRQPTEDGSC